MPNEPEETLAFVYGRLSDIYTHWLVTPRKRMWMNSCVLHAKFAAQCVVTCWFTMMRLIVCAAQANDVSHTHPPPPSKPADLAPTRRRRRRGCVCSSAQEQPTKRWQWALIPHSAHSLHCLCNWKQHHTSLRFNRPAMLFKCHLDHIPRRWGSRSQKAVRTVILLSLFLWSM